MIPAFVVTIGGLLALASATLPVQASQHRDRRPALREVVAPSPPISASGEIDSPFSVNLEILAEDLIRGQANVTIIGDSVNTFGNTNSMFKGYLLAWQPNRWRQIHTAVSSNSNATGAWLQISGSGNYMLLRPGEGIGDLEPFAGTNTWVMRVLWGDGWSGRALSAGFNELSWVFDSGMLRDADGNQRFLHTEDLYRHRAMIVAGTDPLFRSSWTVRSRNSANGTLWNTNLPNRSFNPTPEPGLCWFDDVLEGSTAGEGHQGTALYSDRQGAFGPDEKIGLCGTVITNQSLEQGLGLTYIGKGGWRAENHRYPFGHPDVPIINSATIYPGSYRNEALRRHFLAHETTHVMIWIGTNNSGIDANFPERTIEDVSEILVRYREVHELARLENSALPPVEFLLIAPYASGMNPFFQDYAAGLRTLASSDTAVIDLDGIVRDQIGEWDQWNTDLLLDSTHPNVEGAKFFASRIWRELIAAAGPTADLNRDGVVNGADFGLLLGQWGCEDPGYADLTGDGCVTGSDIGIMLGQWTIGSGG